MAIHDSSKQPSSNSTLITGIHDFAESFKFNRTKWRAKVSGQTDEELQRLEFKLRHDEIAAAAGLVTSGGVLLTSLAFPLAAPPGAAGMALSNHRRQCAHDKLKFLRAMLAERGVKPHPDDFVHDALIPVMSGVLGSVASAGVSEFGLTAHLASVSIPTSTGGNTTAAVAHAISNINPDDIKSGATVFVQGAASGVMNESHQLLGHVIASAPVNVAHAGVFSDGVWVGDKIVDTIITTVMGTGVPKAVEMAIDTINSKRTKHCGWWCVECNESIGEEPRYHCTSSECLDHNICSKCYSENKHFDMSHRLICIRNQVVAEICLVDEAFEDNQMSFVARTCNGCEKYIYESCSHCMHNDCKDFDLCSTCMQGPPRAQHQHPEMALIRNPFSVSLADSGFKKNSTCDLCESSLSQSIAYKCFEERCHTLLCENCTEKSEHDSSHRVSCIQFPGARKMRVANSTGITDCHECECGISGPAYYCTEPECKLKYDSCETCMRRKAHPTSHRMVCIRNPITLLLSSDQPDRSLKNHIYRPEGYYASCDDCSQPIEGVGFACQTCPNYDLCDRCISKNIHPSGHEMSIILSKKATKLQSRWPFHSHFWEKE